MGILPVRREDDELLGTSCLPRPDQVVHQTVESLEVYRCRTREVTHRRSVHAIFYSWRPQHLELGGQVVCEPLDDDRVAAEREMWAVLFGRPDRDDQPRIA
jgi:hypothetical protein